MSKTEHSKILAGLTLLILVVVIVGVSVASDHKSTAASMPTSTPVATTKQSSSSTTTTTASSSSGTYKDGTYTATGTYNSPGGQEKVMVELTVSNNVVSSSSVMSGANDPTAESYQSIFIGGYKKYVVGKKLNDINVSNVSGSSLTSIGFKDALKQIEKQAQT
jgi:uncharacterized protein with FMN-binding domain